MTMVRWALRQYGGDPGRVFVTGVSSGAMMTNVMVADYPDVFQAGAAFAGVPDGCFATNNGSTWNSECANVHRLSTTPTSTDHPQANWTRRKYSDKVESISLQNVGHNLMAAGMALRAIQFFGLDRR